jgi:hypothetical protein
MFIKENFSTIHCRIKISFSFTFLALVFLATACGAIDARVTIYPNEEWSALIRITLNPQEAGMVSEGEFSKQAAQWRARGVKYDWHKEKDDVNTVYVFTTEGKGFHLLNEMVFSNRATIV